MSNSLQSPSFLLDTNWVTTGLIDFEFKKYILLDYIQKCQSAFQSIRLYPPLSELCLHYKNLQDLKSGLADLEKQFPKELAGLDFRQLAMHYQSHNLKNQEIETIQEIIEYALPTVKQTISEGKGIYDCIEQQLEIQPVGLLPIHKEAGYLFIHTAESPEVLIYQFQQNNVIQHDEMYRQLTVQYVTHSTISLSNTPESIKLTLIHQHPELPQPATFDCVCHMSVPMHETLIPIAKRAVLRYLTQLDKG